MHLKAALCEKTSIAFGFPIEEKIGKLKMPFIHVKSLPFEEKIDISNVIRNVAIDFSGNTDIQLCHIHTTWEYYQSGHYAKGDKISEFQPKKNYPIIVELFTPDSCDLKLIGIMLESIANSISKNTGFPQNNIFIRSRVAKSNTVFDDGQIVEW